MRTRTAHQPVCVGNAPGQGRLLAMFPAVKQGLGARPGSLENPATAAPGPGEEEDPVC